MLHPMSAALDDRATRDAIRAAYSERRRQLTRGAKHGPSTDPTLAAGVWMPVYVMPSEHVRDHDPERLVGGEWH